MTHTPGPWIHKHPAYYADDEEQILGPNNELIACYVTPTNAAILAAAPELLEALEYALETLQAQRNADEMGLYPIQAAIRKARGE